MASKKEDKDREPDRGVPDAVLFPGNLKVGTTIWDRLGSVNRLVGPVLGLPVHVSEKPVEGDYYFVRSDPHESFLNPSDHPTRPKQSKYDWELQPNGLKYGWKKPEDVAAAELAEAADAAEAARPIRRARGDAPGLHTGPTTPPTPEHER